MAEIPTQFFYLVAKILDDFPHPRVSLCTTQLPRINAKSEEWKGNDNHTLMIEQFIANNTARTLIAREGIKMFINKIKRSE